mmetsp:Transcript_10237/g.14106  ORF Transcript_10237/g.14106 Transcript_10237/m.14106 type:complete len:227 (-) Transcript_10237:692-1372(-)
MRMNFFSRPPDRPWQQLLAKANHSLRWILMITLWISTCRSPRNFPFCRLLMATLKMIMMATATPSPFLMMANLCHLSSSHLVLGSLDLWRGIRPSPRRPAAKAAPSDGSIRMARKSRSLLLVPCAMRFARAWPLSSSITLLPPVAPPKHDGCGPHASKARDVGFKARVALISMVGLRSGMATNIGRRFVCACYSHLRPRTSAMRVVPPYYVVVVYASIPPILPFTA